MKKTVDMINGRLLPNMIMFAFPVILSGVLQILYNAADSIIVGRYDSALALGAVGSTNSVINLIVGLFIGIALGTNVLVARFYGGNNMKRAKMAADTGIILAVITGILGTVAGVLLAEPIARMMKIDSEIIDMSILYMKIYFIGVPFTSLFNFTASALRGMGDSKNPMYCSVIAGAVNVLFNIIFVKYFHMGVAGVAAATVISQAVSAVLAFIALRKSEIKFRVREICFNKKICIDTIMIGFPAGLQGAVFSISNIIGASGVNYFGAAAATGNSIVLQVDGLIYAVINSITQTVTPFTSQNLGAKKMDRINKILYSGWGIAVVLGVVLSGISYMLKYQIIEIFAPNGNSDPALQAEIIKYALARFNWCILPYFTVGFMEIVGGVLKGMGRTVLAMAMSVIGVCGLRVSWQLIVFPMFRTIETLYVAYPISWFGTGVAYTIAYFAVKKKIDRQFLRE